MMHPPASMEHCLKALGLVYNRLGAPGLQENEDFEFLLEGETRDELVDLMMTVAGMVALVLEELPSLYEALETLSDADPITQATAVLDSLRDMFVNQAVDELTT